MRALVTGGAGFIGSNLVRALLDGGHEVAILDNFLSGHRSNLVKVPEARLFEGDVRQAEVVDQAVRGVDVVFHLAASVGNKRSIDQPLVDSEINVLGTLQVLEAARRSGVGKIVVSSSAGIFGELKTLPIREDHPIEPDSPYGCSKLCEEKLCLSYGRLYGIEAVALRYFNVYGPNQRFDAYGNVIPIFTFRLLRGEGVTIWGDGEQTRDFVNVQDVVQANVRAALARGVSGAFNIGSGVAITVNELVRLLRGQCGKHARITHGPPRPGDVRHSAADIAAARQAFGFDPKIRLAHGLKEYVAWARSEGSG